jgi:CCAAT/enhancer binding protein (C/EBP) gamma
MKMARAKKSNNPGQRAKGNREEDEEYLHKREKNNAAVKRARQKAKERVQQTHNRIQNIKTENEELEEKIRVLSAELAVMKNIYSTYTDASN